MSHICRLGAARRESRSPTPTFFLLRVIVMDINHLIVRFDDGSVNIDDTIEKVRIELMMKSISDDNITKNIFSITNEVFDAVPANTRIPMPSLVKTVTSKLVADPKDFTKVSIEVDNFIRSFPQKFDISRGRTGGAKRIS